MALKINRTVAAEYGTKFGGYLIQIEKDNYDKEYNKKKAEGNKPFLPITAVPIYAIKRTFVNSISFIDDPTTNGKLICFNGDAKLTVPCDTPMSKDDVSTIAEILKGAATNDDLSTHYFADEESVFNAVSAFNKRTIAQLEDQIREFANTIEGLSVANKAMKENVESSILG